MPSRTQPPSAAAPAPERVGRAEPRIYTPPLGPLTRQTTLGYDVIDFAEAIGIVLFPWQQWLLIHMLELDAAGQLRFRTVVVLVARQNGKSTVSQVLALWFMVVWGWQTVLGTAQDLETAEEVWQGVVDLVEGDRELSTLLQRVIKVNGKKALELTNGSRYKVKAANRRAGRGFAGNLVMLDELREHQSWDSWGAITKTTMAQVESLVLALSNAGDATSLVLRYLRLMAHRALSDPDGINRDAAGPEGLLPAAGDTGDDDLAQAPDTLAIFEWSAPPGCAVDDREAWAQSNPAMNHPNGIAERNIISAMRTDPDKVFRTEVLCQWSDTSIDGPFPDGAWTRGVDPESTIPVEAPVVYGLDLSADRTRAYIAAAGRRADDVPHVEVVAARAGADWVADWFAARATAEAPMTVTLQARGAPVSYLAEELTAVNHLTVVDWGGPDLGNATAKLYELVADSHVTDDGHRRGLAHLPQPVLDVAAALAVPRVLTDGGMAWDRRRSPVDIAPLVAVTAALWRLLQPAETTRSAYEDRGVLTI